MNSNVGRAGCWSHPDPAPTRKYATSSGIPDGTRELDELLESTNRALSTMVFVATDEGATLLHDGSDRARALADLVWSTRSRTALAALLAVAPAVTWHESEALGDALRSQGHAR